MYQACVRWCAAGGASSGQRPRSDDGLPAIVARECRWKEQKRGKRRPTFSSAPRYCANRSVLWREREKREREREREEMAYGLHMGEGEGEREGERES